MNRILTACLVAAAILCSCARERHVVKTPRPSKRLVLIPEDVKKPSMRPYVVNGQRYYPLPSAEGFIQRGKASWYGKKFHGRPTASGEIYDMYKRSAAHKILPLGTFVNIVNLENGRSAVVRINDRGPFVKGRIVDLSYASAKDLGIVKKGTADVRLVALGKEVDRIDSPQGVKPVVEVKEIRRGEFSIQVGAFSSRENALRLADRLKVLFDYVDVNIYQDMERGDLYRVRVSKSKSLKEAQKAERRLEEMGFEGAFIVSL